MIDCKAVRMLPIHMGNPKNKFRGQLKVRIDPRPF